MRARVNHPRQIRSTSATGSVRRLRSGSPSWLIRERVQRDAGAARARQVAAASVWWQQPAGIGIGSAKSGPAFRLLVLPLLLPIPLALSRVAAVLSAQRWPALRSAYSSPSAHILRHRRLVIAKP